MFVTGSLTVERGNAARLFAFVPVLLLGLLAVITPASFRLVGGGVSGVQVPMPPSLSSGLAIPSLGGGSITLVKSGAQGNYSYWLFEDAKYPCGEQGNHQFLVLQKGSAVDTRNLIVRHIGGFAGFYYQTGAAGQEQYFPSDDFEALLKSGSQMTSFGMEGLEKLVVDAPGWRLMSPSYCSHDFYLGTGQYNATDGFARWGYSADKAAIDFTEQHFPTNKIVMYGTSAGVSGAFYQGITRANVAGIVMDSFAMDLSAVAQACEKGIQPYLSKWPCSCSGATCIRTLAARVGFQVGQDEPYLKIQRGQVTKPIFFDWDTNDYVANGRSDVQFSNLAQALQKYNPGGKSVNDQVCVTDPKYSSLPCNVHSPTLLNDVPVTTQAYKWIMQIVQ